MHGPFSLNLHLWVHLIMFTVSQAVEWESTNTVDTTDDLPTPPMTGGPYDDHYTTEAPSRKPSYRFSTTEPMDPKATEPPLKKPSYTFSTTEPLDPLGLHSRFNCDSGSCRNRCNDRSSHVSKTTDDSAGGATGQTNGLVISGGATSPSNGGATGQFNDEGTSDSDDGATTQTDGEDSSDSDGEATAQSNDEISDNTKTLTFDEHTIDEKEQCSCGKSCMIFGDCCIDYFSLCLDKNLTVMLSNVSNVDNLIEMMQQVFDNDTSISEKVSMYLFKSCTLVHGEHGKRYYWMISDCPTKGNINGNTTEDENESQCRSTLSEPIGTVPASLTRQPDIVYRNVYCALCNGVERSELTFWKSTSKCTKMESLSEISYEEFLEKLETSECVVQSESPGGARQCLPERDESLDSCSLFDEKEQGFKANTLHCRSYMYPLITANNEKSKNWHCAACSELQSLHENNFTCESVKKTFLFYNTTLPICPNMSCNGVCHKQTEKQNCQCDIECLLYGDCCFDFIPVCLGNEYELIEVSKNKSLIRTFLDQINITSIPSQQENAVKDIAATDNEFVPKNVTSMNVDGKRLMMLYNKYRTCLAMFGDSRYQWVIGSCPGEKMNTQCEPVGERINRSLIAPASHKMYPGVIFRNIYCGLCHGVPLEDLKQWSTSVYCQNPVESFVSEETLLSDGRCVLQVQDLGKGRTCSEEDSKILKTSQKTKNSPLSGVLCQAYRYPVISDDGNPLRNPHCEHTEGVIPSCLSYKKKELPGMAFDEEDHKQPSAALKGLIILFNFNENGVRFESRDGVSMFPEVSCQMDEVYDDYHDRCKKLQCQLGKVAINGSCIRNGTWIADKKNMVFVNGTKEFIIASYIIIEEYLRKDNIHNILHEIVMGGKNARYQYLLESDDVKITNVTHLPIFLTKNSSRYLDGGKQLKHLQIVINKAGSVHQHLNAFSLFVQRLLDNIENSENILDVSIQNFVSENQITCSFGKVMELTNISMEMVSEVIYANDSDVLYPLDNVAFVCGIIGNIPHLRNVYVCDIPLNCDPVAYNLTDFTLEDGVLKSLHSDLVLSNNSYFVQGNEVLSCHNFSHSFLRNQSNIFFRFDHVQDILTYVTSGISVVSLILTLTVYIILPELHNLPGRLTMSLSACLMLAQGLLLLIHLPTGVLCQTLAITLHFLWLCSFMWMTAMSINLAQTFTHKMKGSSMSSTAGSHARFSLFVVGFPLVIVTVSAVLDFLDMPGIDIGYGKHGLCWIANPRASLLVFGVPLALIILVNLIAFIVTFYNIEKGLRSSKDISSTKGDRYKVIIYGKLFIIMGLSWGFSFAAAFADFAALWYIFILLNGLQGFYIFISFICTDRVKRLLKKKILGPDVEESISTKTKTTISKI